MDMAQQRVDLREVNRNDLLEPGDPMEPPACVVFVRQFPQRDEDIDEANVALLTKQSRGCFVHLCD